MRFPIVLLACVAFVGSNLNAFPPAPGTVVYGLVKDADGQTVDGPNAFIVFKSGDVEIARSSLQAGISPSENYRALLPNDMNSSTDGYKDGVLNGALPFTVEVIIGWQTFDPIESSAGLVAPDEPGSAVRFDFSLETDSDADGLPDEWEFAQLLKAGIEAGSARYNLDQLSGDGDFDSDGLTDREEYLAGTFAYLGFDTMAFQVIGLDAQGRLLLEFLAVAGHRYRFEGSTDLKAWESIDVSLSGFDSLPTDPVATFESEDTRILSVAIQTQDGERLEYFRLKIDRNF